MAVQSGSHTWVGSTLTNDVTISAVDLSKTFPVISVRTSETAQNRTLISAELIDSTTLRLSKTNINGTPTIDWFVVELGAGSVQKFTGSLVDNVAVNIAISPVTLAESFAVVTNSSESGTNNFGTLVVGHLTSSTNLQIRRNDSDTGATRTSYYVIYVVSIPGAVVQQGINTASNASINITLSAVDLSRTFVLTRNSDIGASGTTAQRMHRRAELTSTTNLALTRDSTSTSFTSYAVIQLPAGSSVQKFNTASSSTNPVDTDITAIDLTKSIIVSTQQSTSTTTGTYASVLQSAKYLDNNTVRLERSSTTGQVQSTAYAVQFVFVSDVSKSSAIAWSIRSITSKNQSSLWNVRALLVKQQASSWRIRANVSDSVASLWDIRQSVLVDVDSAWNIVSQLGISVDSRWNIGVAVVSFIESTWHAAGVLETSFDTEWNVLEWTSGSQHVEWNVYLSVGKFVESLWHLRSIIGESVESLWNINNIFNVPADVRWDIHQFVDYSIESIWNVYNSVEASQSTLWDISELTDVLAGLESAWNAIGRLEEPASIGSTWNINEYIGKTIETLWNQAGYAIKSQRVAWRNLSNIFTPYNNIEYTKRVLEELPHGYWKLNSHDALKDELNLHELTFMTDHPIVSPRGLVVGDDSSVRLIDSVGASAGFRYINDYSIYQDSWSIEAWLSLHTGTGGAVFSDEGFEFGWEDGKLYTQVGDTRLESASDYANNEVLHVVFTYDLAVGTFNIIVNGVVEATEEIEFTPPTATDLFIGGHVNTFNGSIDELAIYERALDSTVAARHYALGTDIYDYSELIEHSRPEMYWNFEQFYPNYVSQVGFDDAVLDDGAEVVSSVLSLESGDLTGTATFTLPSADLTLQKIHAYWTETVPADAFVKVEVSVDSGDTWIVLENNFPLEVINGLILDDDLQVRVTLTAETTEPTVENFRFYAIYDGDETFPAVTFGEGQPIEVTEAIVTEPGIFFANSGGAIEFTGTSPYIDLGPITVDNELTYEVWFKPTEESAAIESIIGAANNPQIRWQGDTSRTVQFFVAPSGGVINVHGITLNEWHHVVASVVYEETETYISMWIDGVEYTHTIDSSVTPPTRTYLNRRDSVSSWAGLISNPAVYLRKLSGVEITRHWQAGEYGKYIPVRAEVPAPTISTSNVTMYSRPWQVQSA